MDEASFDVTIRVTITNGKTVSTRDCLDFIEHRLDRYRDVNWGAGRGSINYADAEVTAVVRR